MGWLNLCRVRLSTGPTLEIGSVLRRMTALLAVWLGLLGVVAPALACAADAPDDVCCPQEAPLQCTDNEPGYRAGTPAAMCCVPANVRAQAASIDSRRSTQDREHDSGTPDPLIPSASLDSLTGVTYAPHINNAPPHSQPRTDAALTYLRTGRLRL